MFYILVYSISFGIEIILQIILNMHNTISMVYFRTIHEVCFYQE